MEFDPHTRLLKECKSIKTAYPDTLLERYLPRSVLKRYRDYLSENEATLFDSSKACILLWEAWTGDSSKASLTCYTPNRDMG